MNNIEILEEQLNYWKDLIERTEISNAIYSWIKNDKIKQKTIALENKELKERIQKVINFIDNDNTYFEDGESWQNISYIIKILNGSDVDD